MAGQREPGSSFRKLHLIEKSVSREQVAWAKAKYAHLPIDIRLDDYRNATGSYDAVVSIGLLEHVGPKNHRAYMEQAVRCLADLDPKETGAKPVPSHVMWPDEGRKFTVLVANPPGEMSATKALAITEEPEGGSLQPTTTPKWVGTTR